MQELHAFQLKIHAGTEAETIAEIESAIGQRNRAIQQIVVNVAKIVHAQNDEELRSAINNSDIVNIDGQGVVWALKLLGYPIPGRVAGCDLFQKLIALSAEKGYRPYFFGAKQEVLDEMLSRFRALYPNLEIAGARNGYYSAEDEAGIAAEIAAAKPDMLFLGITSPKKELFIDRYTAQMNIPYTMGVGGSFDVVAGKVKRAPRWMQRVGLEWFYRILQEPRRMWKRYAVTNSKFFFLLLREFRDHREKRGKGEKG